MTRRFCPPRRSLRCFLGFHDWRISRLIPLNITGPVYICDRCGRQQSYDHGDRV